MSHTAVTQISSRADQAVNSVRLIFSGNIHLSALCDPELGTCLVLF
jgi:hypothetical protein